MASAKSGIASKSRVKDLLAKKKKDVEPFSNSHDTFEQAALIASIFDEQVKKEPIGATVTNNQEPCANTKKRKRKNECDRTTIHVQKKRKTEQQPTTTSCLQNNNNSGNSTLSSVQRAMSTPPDTLWYGDMDHSVIRPSKSMISHFGKNIDIQTQFISLWHVDGKKSKNYNPSPNPVSISRQALDTMNPDQYVVSEKTDGVRYNLLLCTLPDGERVAVMINRACKKYEIQVCADASYFQGTLFDGELVWEKGPNDCRLIYWVFDIVTLKGESLMNEPYATRFEQLHRVLSDTQNYPILPPEQSEKRALELAKEGKIVCTQRDAYLCFRPKASVATKNIRALWDTIPYLGHSCDGLIFTPLNKSMQTGTDWHQFKWKTEHTIDLELRGKKEKAWIFGLYYIEADYTVPEKKMDKTDQLYDRPESKPDSLQSCQASFQNACRGVAFENRTVYFVLEVNPLLEDFLNRLDQAKPDANYFKCIVECKAVFKTPAQLLCSIKRIRVDKSVPNNRYTVKQIMLNIQENILFEDICLTLLNKKG